jgi:hypothetical protein
MSYNPIPTRVWSRVQNQCTYIEPNSTYQQSYIPLTGQIVSQAQADYEMKQIYKGNILQYKDNSARFTKSQKYSQLARMAGPNRTKVFATQSQTYTNPNTTSLLRVGYNTYTFPNQIVGAPNNISGPFSYGIVNPNDCSDNSIQDGGTLVCGTYANPCSGEIYIEGSTTSTICNPASASNVPGNTILCWNNKVQTWFPRQRYFMNNSTDKWPNNYKGFVSAIKPVIPTAPVLYLNYYKKYMDNKEINIESTKSKDANDTKYDINSTKYDIHFYWKSNYIFKIDSFNIYINNHLYKNIKNDNKFTHVINNFTHVINNFTHVINNFTHVINNHFISITSIVNNIESKMSNYIFFNHDTPSQSQPIDPSNCSCDLSNCCCDLSNCSCYCSCDLTDVNNLLTIIDEKINNINSNINNKMDNVNSKMDNVNSKMDNVNSKMEEFKLDMNTNFSDLELSYNLLDQNINIKTENINNTLDIITNSITNLFNVTVLDKLSLFKNCDCSCSCSCSNDSSCNCVFYNALFSSSVITKINNYVSTYIETIYQDTNTYIPIDIFHDLNIELISLENLFVSDPSCCFFNIIDIYRNMIKIVKTAYDNKNLAKSTLINAESWKNDSIILNDRDKLNEYIQNLSKNFFVTSVNITSVYANLKTQYQIYIQLYGLPENLDFDTDKLNNILKQIGDY